MATASKLLLCGLLLVISSGLSDCTSVSIVLSSADENVTVRSTVLLVCVAYGGDTAPSIVWYRNGRPIQNDTDLRYTVYNSTTSSSGLVFAEAILEICSIGLDEGGEYICNASSVSGDSSTTNTTTLTVLERGEPDRPCNCSSVPVYSETGSLISIEFNWTKVASPPVVVAGVNPNITSYNVSVEGFGAHVVPAESVCVEPGAGGRDPQMSQCTYSYPVPQSFKTMTAGARGTQVAAVNEIGQGRTCSPTPSNIGEMNSYNLMLSVDTTGRIVTLTCTRGQGFPAEQRFWCDFCYASDGSCQGSSGSGMSCTAGLSDTWILPTLSEGTYCYRATAVVEETPAAVVQDTFNIRQQATGGDNLVSALAASITTSFIAAFIIGLLVGFLPCLCYYRRRSKHDPQRVCLSCTNSASIGGGNGETKETGLYEPIPPMPQKEKEIDISTNEAYGKLPSMNPVAVW